MLSPGEGEYEQIVDIIVTRERNSLQLKENDIFDEYQGWGHPIVPPDQWVTRKESGTNWTFMFAFTDQGLLYQWVKYVKQSVSIIFYDRVENWSFDVANDVPVLEREIHNPFVNYSNPLIRTFVACKKYMCDFHHFTGVKKPWLRHPPTEYPKLESDLKYGWDVWWYYLYIANEEHNLGIDFDNWVPLGRPTQGLYATYTSVRERKAMIT